MEKLQYMIDDASNQFDFWRELAADGDADSLDSQDVTREEAQEKASFYSGRFRALCDVRDLEK